MPPFGELAVQTLNDAIIQEGVSSKLIYEGSVCDGWPCFNDGACVTTNRSLSGYLCFCNQLFTGSQCDVRLQNNCTTILCKPGTFCAPAALLPQPINALASCISSNQYGLFPSCDFNFCSNTGKCIIVQERRLCVCPSSHTGLLCQTPIISLEDVPISWNAFQFLFLFSIVFLLISALVALCYCGQYGCYVHWPSTRPRYKKWNADAAKSNELDLAWDDEVNDFDGQGSVATCSEDDEDVESSNSCSQKHKQTSRQQRASVTETSENCFEMKSKPLKVSKTAETFITYSPTRGANPAFNDASSSTLESQNLE